MSECCPRANHHFAFNRMTTGIIGSIAPLGATVRNVFLRQAFQEELPALELLGGSAKLANSHNPD